MTNYLLESKHNATQENHFVRICNQWVAGSTPVTSSKKDPAIYRQNGGVYRGIFAFLCVVKRPESATKVRQIPQNSI